VLVDREVLVACLLQVDADWRAPVSSCVTPGERIAA
jgi:hypothetical protein